MRLAAQGVDAALASQTQNLDRIEQAKGLPIEVLQSIQALAQARRDYLRTVIDYDTAAIHALPRRRLAVEAGQRIATRRQAMTTPAAGIAAARAHLRAASAMRSRSSITSENSSRSLAWASIISFWPLRVIV